MALYEITFLTKEETDPGVKDLIEGLGGAITAEGSLGRRRLAYPIKKENNAVYTSYVFDIEQPQLAEMNRKLGLNTAILRYLVVTKPVEKQTKEVSKAVREAIAAAEKLEDTPVEATAQPVVETPAEIMAEAPVETPVEEPAQTEAPALAAEEIVPVVEPTEATEEKTEEKSEEEKKPRARKAAKADDASTATEEDRLKALEDKLGEILKD